MTLYKANKNRLDRFHQKYMDGQEGELLGNFMSIEAVLDNAESYQQISQELGYTNVSDLRPKHTLTLATQEDIEEHCYGEYINEQL